MNRHKPLLTTAFFVTAGLAGIYAQNAVLTSGGDASGTGGTVAYSIGQIAYTSIDGEDGSMSLGVQQPNLVIMVGTEEPEITLSASIYPNPVNTSVNLTLDEPNQMSGAESLSFGLYDINGKLLLQKDIVTTVTVIPMGNLTNALYILRVTNNNAEIKTFKIFKTN